MSQTPEPASRPAGDAATQAPRPAPPPRPAEDRARVQAGRAADRQIEYKVTPQGPLTMHVYLPSGWKAGDRRPVIVFFHGGGWAQGTPDQFFSRCEYFASRGLVAVSAQYRLKRVHGTGPDASAEDARSAIRYVRAHAKSLGIDGRKLIAGGGSAGGHLAAAVALCPDSEVAGEDPAISVVPQALVLFNPVLDVTGLGSLGQMPKNVHEMSAEARESICPISHLRKDCPPALVMFGTTDRLLAQGQGFVERSAAMGNRVELWLADGVGHGFFNAQPWHDATTVLADRFLVSLGYLSGEPTIAEPPAPSRLHPAAK